MGPGQQAASRTDQGSRGSSSSGGKSSGSGDPRATDRTAQAMAGVSYSGPTTQNTGKTDAKNDTTRNVFQVTTAATPKTPAPPTAPSIVSAPPPGQVGDYSPVYNWSDTDRVKQALGLALDVATGSIFGFAADAFASESGMFGEMTAPRGYTKTGVRVGAARSSDANAGIVPPQLHVAAPIVPQAPKWDKFFSFFNPAT